MNGLNEFDRNRVIKRATGSLTVRDCSLLSFRQVASRSIAVTITNQAVPKKHRLIYYDHFSLCLALPLVFCFYIPIVNILLCFKLPERRSCSLFLNLQAVNSDCAVEAITASRAAVFPGTVLSATGLLCSFVQAVH
jgi:hypothetical protein